MPDTTLTSAGLDELERLAKAATPGPWKAETNEKAANVTILGRSADKGRTRASDGHAYLLTVDCSDGIDDGAYAIWFPAKPSGRWRLHHMRLSRRSG